MKIGLITVHRTLNYGTMLQAYACKCLFKKYGYEMFLIDYFRNNDYRTSSFKSVKDYYGFRKQVQKVKNLKGCVMLSLKSVITYKTTKHFKEICDSFLESNFDLTKEYYSIDSLMNDPPLADIYCAGSDQIWNSEYNNGLDKAYYLAFAPANSRKISFCSSIGTDLLTPTDGNKVKELLDDFSAISVREEQAKAALRQIGIEATDLIDPTLLLSCNEWENSISKPLVKEPYLLIYKLKGDSRLDFLAEKIAKQRKLKIVRIAFGELKKKKGETTVVLPRISEFLSLIKYADFVVTNSFHGTCFSINFNRQFVSVTRGNYNSRIANILNKTNLSDRLYSNIEQGDFLLSDICYEKVNQRIDDERKKAKDWLQENLREHI